MARGRPRKFENRAAANEFFNNNKEYFKKYYIEKMKAKGYLERFKERIKKIKEYSINHSINETIDHFMMYEKNILMCKTERFHYSPEFIREVLDGSLVSPPAPPPTLPPPPPPVLPPLSIYEP
jgi:hypothetical protein